MPRQTEGALEPLYQQGVAALQARRMDEAQRIFGQVLAQDPRHARARIGLADVAISRNDRAGAEPHLREALAAQPNAPEPAIALAAFHNATGQAGANGRRPRWPTSGCAISILPTSRR